MGGKYEDGIIQRKLMYQNDKGNIVNIDEKK